VGFQVPLKKAIELEPRFARSYAELAGVYEVAGSDAAGILSPTNSAEMAAAAARQALGLDKTLGAAHRVLGQVKRDYDWDFAGADSEFDAALADSPDDPATLREQAWLRLLQDRGSEALAIALQAQRLDPLDMGTATMVSVIYGVLGRPAKGLEELGNVLDFSPSYAPALVTRGSLLAGSGAWSEAISSYEKALSVEPSNPDLKAMLAFAYAKAGRDSDARKAAAELAATPSGRYVSSAARALAALGLGETETSLQLLEKAAEERSRAVLTLRFRPEWNDLRSAPRFATLVGRADGKGR
jgi:serine/threonine-protein kinase